MNKTILVTGSSRGIGEATVRQFAKLGWNVVITYHTAEDAAKKVAKECESSGAKTLVRQLTARSEASNKQLMQDIETTFGSLDAIVINATDENPKNVEDATYDEWHEVLLTKLDGAWLGVKYALPLLKKSDDPNIVLISSTEAEKPNGEYLAYEVGEAGLTCMGKAWAAELGFKYKVRTNVVYPGATRTDLWDKSGANTDEVWEKFATGNPMGRASTPTDVASAIQLLVCDEHKFLNGVILTVNGGSQHVTQAYFAPKD